MTGVIREADGWTPSAAYAHEMKRPTLERGHRLPVTDLVLAAGLGVFGLVEALATTGVERWLAAPAMLLAGTALAWRRRAPLAAFLVNTGIITASAVFAAPIDSLIVVIPMLALAMYSLAAYAVPNRAIAGLVICVGLIWIATFAPQGPGGENLIFGLVVPGTPWLAGWIVRRRTDQAVELALRAQELEQTQAERERAAVAQERDRIARELHDIIAHSVSVMTIQAGAVEEVLDLDPQRARQAAASIRRTGRQAQLDLRRLLGLLRDEDDSVQPLTPQPGLADLEHLLDSVRRAGLDVRLTVDGTPRKLPAAVDLSAFRVVQEALTNTLKHAHASVASVGVCYGTDAIDIVVIDDGALGTDGDGAGDAGEGDMPPGAGHGLVGMRERVALYGGALDFGHAPAGGFRVHALLPVGGESG
jgi:signal transduction histidine kinase